MSRVVLAGTALAVLGPLVLLLSWLLGPEVQPVALVGVALGGALGLVPSARAAGRAGGFAAGFAIAWIGYFVRAAALPDSTGGRAVAVLVVLLACVAVAFASRDRLPLWSSLLGAAAMAGAFEATFAADPSGVATTSPGPATAVLLTAAAGFLVATLLAPTPRREPVPGAGGDPAVLTDGTDRPAEARLVRDDAPLTTRPLEPAPEV